ncbi:unnamed protein product [Boreogadus saida]
MKHSKSIKDRSQHSDYPSPSVSLGPEEVRPDLSECAQKQLTPHKVSPSSLTLVYLTCPGPLCAFPISRGGEMF